MASNTDDWQMEAIHTQFDVFDSLDVPYKEIDLKNTSCLMLVADVHRVIEKHLQPRNQNVDSRTLLETTKLVVSDLHTTCNGTNESVLKYSFVVIVTNQNALNRGLSKIPIFIVTLGRQSVFIDINSNIFSSWDSFMQRNSLPACDFCFPVNGRYDVGGKLKIDFASSPAAAQSLVRTSMSSNVDGRMVGVVGVAASCFIKVAPICLHVVNDLMSVAVKFISHISPMKSDISTLGKLLIDFRTKKRQNWDVMVPAFVILLRLGKLILSGVKDAWEGMKKSLDKAYSKLKRMFPKQFASASASSQHNFLALTESVVSQAVDVERCAKKKISAATTFMSGSAQDRTTLVDSNDENTKHLRSIFSDSITDCALQNGLKPFEKSVNDMLDVTKEIADDQQITNLDELRNIFESVSCTVFEEYNYKIECYSNGLKAAKQATNNAVDVDAYNNAMGIKGDPKDHFMKESIQSLNKTLRSKFKVMEKTNELRKNSKTVLIPLWKKHSDDDFDGLYRCIGVQGAGKLSHLDLISILQEKVGNLGNFQVTNWGDSTSTLTTVIHSDEFHVLVSQQVNEGNTCEGLVFYQKV